MLKWLLFINKPTYQNSVRGFIEYLLLIMQGLLFTNISIFNKNMADPICKKKIPKLFFIKILFFLLCNKCTICFHEIKGNTVS